MTKTRQRIIDASLDLFSRNGYDAVSVEQIASKVGIKAPSLYSHFRSKEAIFDELIDQVEYSYRTGCRFAVVPWDELEKDIDAFATKDPEAVYKRVEEIFLSILDDELIGKHRRLMTIEQYRNEKLANLNNHRLLEDIVNYHSIMFRRLIKEGVVREENPEILALEYSAPINNLLAACERDNARRNQALDTLKKHISLFMQTFVL